MFNCLPSEYPLDLTVFIADVQIVKTRKKLWEMIDFYTTWIEEWKQSVFCQVNRIQTHHTHKHTPTPMHTHKTNKKGLNTNLRMDHMV